MQDRPATEIVAAFDQEKSLEKPNYDFDNIENTLNQMGYKKLANGAGKDAIALFRLNVREHPDSGNAYDSLGEALLENENLKAARKNYRKALSLNPDNTHAAKVIEKITLELSKIED